MIDFQVLAPILTIAVVVIAIFGRINVINKWKSLPTLDEYISENPEAKIAKGIKCIHCDASSIRNWWLDGVNAKRRQLICNQCGETLYRSKD